MLETLAVGDGEFALSYQDVGEGPPVVFLHGFGANHLSWWQQVPTVTENYRFVAPDQRRFGLSVDTEGRGVAAFVDDLRALLDHLDVERAALVGHSMGGWTVGSFATQYPDRVAALVLSATPGGLIPPAHHHDLLAAADDAPAVDPLSAELSFLTDAIGELNRDAPDEWEETRAVLDDLPLDADRVVEAGIPTLVVAGEADEFMPTGAIDAVAERLDAASAVVGGAAHSVYFERPDAFNRHVVGFLDDEATF